MGDLVEFKYVVKSIPEATTTGDQNSRFLTGAAIPGVMRMTSAANVSPRRTRNTKLRRALFVIFVVIPAVCFGAVFYLLRREPEHWKTHKAFIRNTTPSHIKTMAANVLARLDGLANLGFTDVDTHPETTDQAISAEGGKQASRSGQIDFSELASEQSDGKTPLSELKIDVVREMFVRDDELRALVAARFDEWMESRGYVMPKGITDPTIAIDGNTLILAFEYRTPHFSQVISAKFDLEIEADGMALLTLEEFLAGSLPVPVHAIGRYLAEQVPGDDEGVAKVGEWLGKLEQLRFKPVLELKHRRRAQVTAYDVVDGGIELTVRIQDYRTYKGIGDSITT